MAKKKAAKKVTARQKRRASTPPSTFRKPRQKRRARQPAPKARPDPNAIDNLTLPAAAAALSPEGATPIPPATLRRDEAAGVPVARDGTWSLPAYAAWMIGRTRRK